MSKAKIIQIDFGKNYVDLDHDPENADWLHEVRKPKYKYRVFFTDLIERYNGLFLNYIKVKPQLKSFIAFGAGRGLKYAWSFVEKKKNVQIELYIDVGDREENLKIFDYLFNRRIEIENELSELSWESLPGKRACRVALCRGGTIAKIENLNDDEKKIIGDWFVEVTPKFIYVFSKYIDQLPK